MDKASASGAGDSRFESRADHEYCSMMREPRVIGASGLSRFSLPPCLLTCTPALTAKTTCLFAQPSRARTEHVMFQWRSHLRWRCHLKKLELNIRYSLALGYSALTRATRVRVPVAELLCRSCCLLPFRSMPQQDPASTHRKPRNL